jgi:murein L,D-transpeptidase YafK
MKFSTFLSVIFSCFFLWGQVFAQNDFDVESPSEQDISLYAKPEKGEALALIPDGETLHSLEVVKKGDITWHKVKYGEDIGYVNAKFLTESLGKRKAVAAYQQANITKLVLIHATSQYEGLCYLITLDANQKVKIKNRFKCKFGVAGLSKQKEGDKKTPLGHYCVVSESTISNETEEEDTYNKFGGYNIHLNYPNKHDADAKRTGGGICIHGGYSRNTEGCVRIIDEGKDISTKNIVTVGNFVSKGTHVMITNVIPPTFKQKVNVELEETAYQFIQTACSKICSHSEWKNQVEAFTPNLAAAAPIAPTAAPVLSPTPPSTSKVATTPSPSVSTDASGYATGYIKSATGYANLREKPNKDSRSLEKIPVNQPISYKQTGVWWEVISQQGNKGYVHSSLIAK